MADDKKVIFSMVGVNKIYPPQKQVLKNIYLSFFYGAKDGANEYVENKVSYDFPLFSLQIHKIRSIFQNKFAFL